MVAVVAAFTNALCVWFVLLHILCTHWVNGLCVVVSCVCSCVFLVFVAFCSLFVVRSLSFCVVRMVSAAVAGFGVSVCVGFLSSGNACA